MSRYLVVIEPFLDRIRGEIIADAAAIKKILASEWESHVVPVGTDAPAAPPEPAVAVEKK